VRVARERVGDTTLSPRSPNWRTPSSREASRRRSDGSPILLPFHLSVRLTVAGQSISWPRDRRDSRMRLDYVQPGYRTSPFQFLLPPSLAHRRSTSKTSRWSAPTLCPTQKTGVVVNSWSATVKKSVAFVETSFSLPLSLSLFPLSSSLSSFWTNKFRAGHSWIDVSGFLRNAIISHRTVWTVCMSQLFWRRN